MSALYAQKTGFAPTNNVQRAKEGIFVKADGFAAGTVAVSGIVNLKGALSGMGFE